MQYYLILLSLLLLQSTTTSFGDGVSWGLVCTAEIYGCVVSAVAFGFDLLRLLPVSVNEFVDLTVLVVRDAIVDIVIGKTVRVCNAAAAIVAGEELIVESASHLLVIGLILFHVCEAIAV